MKKKENRITTRKKFWCQCFLYPIWISFLRNISKMFPTCYRLVLIWVIILLIFFFPIRQKYFCAISRETFNTIGNKPPICRLLTGLFISSITFYVIWMYFFFTLWIFPSKNLHLLVTTTYNTSIIIMSSWHKSCETK